MVRKCNRCGREIDDLSLHPAAKLCYECRVYNQNPHKLDAERYGPAFKKYLDKHGWPTFATAKKLIDMYPDILADQEFRTDGRRRQVVGVCMRTIKDDAGRGYLPYNHLQFRLSDVPLTEIRKFCRECGALISDSHIHNDAELCPECRAKKHPMCGITHMYGQHVAKYLDTHGWPGNTSGKRLLDMYPDILDGLGVKTSRRKTTILAVCLRTITGHAGQHYVPRNAESQHTRSYDLVDPQTNEGVTA